MNYGPCLERLSVGDRVGVRRTAEGGLRLVINGEDAGLAFPRVRADTRAVVSLTGSCVTITVCDLNTEGKKILYLKHDHFKRESEYKMTNQLL